MARPVTTLVVFFVAFNLFAGTAAAMGVADTIGVNTGVGGDKAVDSQINQGQNVSSGTSTGSTLFGMYNVLAGQVGGFFNVIYPGLGMLARVGVPEAITSMLGGLFSVMIFVDIVSFLRGWGL